MNLPKGMTATELAETSARFFPSADPGALAKLYRPARYSASEPVTEADARRSAALLKALRQSDFAGDPRRNLRRAQKNRK